MASKTKQALPASYHKVITSEHKFLKLNLKEVWQYRDLVFLFTKRDFTVRYKQTILGPAWLFINPIISSLIYCFIFGGMYSMADDEAERNKYRRQWDELLSSAGQ